MSMVVPVNARSSQLERHISFGHRSVIS